MDKLDRFGTHALRALWDLHGSDFEGWPNEAKQEASLIWYQADERAALTRPAGSSRIPDWIPDALSELAASPTSRGVLMGALETIHAGKVTQGLVDLGAVVVAKLHVFAWDTIATYIIEHESDWIVERARDAERGDADSRNDAAALGLH